MAGLVPRYRDDKMYAKDHPADVHFTHRRPDPNQQRMRRSVPVAPPSHLDHSISSDDSYNPSSEARAESYYQLSHRTDMEHMQISTVSQRVNGQMVTDGVEPGRGRSSHKRQNRTRGRSLENQLSFFNRFSPQPSNHDERVDGRFPLQTYDPSHLRVPEKQHLDGGRRAPKQSEYPSNHDRISARKLNRNNDGMKEYYANSQPDVEALISELNVLRTQSTQMEKTLEWWSECTSNWRDKWSRVRTERNRAREELKRLKMAETERGNELSVLRQQKTLLIQENKTLRTGGGRSKQEQDLMSDSSTSSLSNNKGQSEIVAEKKKEGPPSKLDENELAQKIAALQMKVDESAKTIQAERDAKGSLNKRIEELEAEVITSRQRCDEMKAAKQETLKQMSRVQDSHRSEIVRINRNLEEEVESREELEKKVQDLREEVERLQEENTCEWGKRERLETDKLQLERDNKRLKSSNDELKLQVEKKCKAAVEERDLELKEARAQLQQFNQELIDLRRHAAKDQKALQDRHDELTHSRKRADQHEAEVRSLRARVDDLKKQHTSVEDELDQVQNQHRKLVRVAEEKDEDIDKLQLQVDQLQARMRHDAWSKSSYSASVTRTSNRSCEDRDDSDSTQEEE